MIGAQTELASYLPAHLFALKTQRRRRGGRGGGDTARREANGTSGADRVRDKRNKRREKPRNVCQIGKKQSTEEGTTSRRRGSRYSQGQLKERVGWRHRWLMCQRRRTRGASGARGLLPDRRKRSRGGGGRRCFAGWKPRSILCHLAGRLLITPQVRSGVINAPDLVTGHRVSGERCRLLSLAPSSTGASPIATGCSIVRVGQ